LSFRVQVTEPARVRCQLAVQDSTGRRTPVVLAERTVQTPGQWTTLVATSVPSWTGTLVSADLLFDVQKVIVGSTYNPTLTNDVNPFPSFLLDDVSLVRDVDGDGLTDREEQTCTPAPGCPASLCVGAPSPWAASANADSDGDSLPDGWEWRNCLDPNDASDATGAGSPPSACTSAPTPCGGPPATTPPAWDPDCDGASNLEERGAATNPNDACQLPGVPANPSAGPLAKELLRTLAMQPSQGGGSVLVGQHLDDPLLPLVLPNGVSTNQYCHFIEDLRATTQDEPAILSFEYDQCDTTQCYSPAALIQSVNARAIAHWKKGGLVAIKWSPPNPWDPALYGGVASSLRVSNTGVDDPNVDLMALSLGTNPRFNGYLADVAAGLLELKRNGVVVMWRPAAEMSGRHFWWGARPRDAYVAFWRYMFDTLTNQYQLNNLLWTMEADSSVHTFVPVDYYYPGDGYVDIYGQNIYRDDFNVLFDADTLSRYYPKVFAFPQAGPGPTRDGTWDLGRILYGGASGGGLKNAYPRASFFQEWSSYEASSAGINAIFNAHVQGYQTVALVDNRAGLTPEGLFALPGVLSRGELPARTASCQDELQNQGETGIDCGGPCGPCACTTAGGVPLPDGARCNDGDACTQRDRCVAGACVGSVPVVCVACGTCSQSSTCNPQTGACDVTPLPNGSACDDGNPCTLDTCQSGTCLGTTVPDGSSCDDDNACTQASACAAGKCVGSSPITCVASDACHAVGSCDPNTGACSNPSAPDGTSCNDGNSCTQASACSAGVCAGSSPLPDGTSCDDASVCTSSSTCSAGTCVGSGAPGASCDDGVACTVDSCDPVLGCRNDAAACCFDDLQNQGEVGVDCGGPCAPCATSLSVGRDHVCRMQADGTISCWGTNTTGQLGDGTTASSATPSLVTGVTTASALGAGAGHTCAVLSDGVVQCWGDGALGQLGNGTATGTTTPQSITVPGAGVTGISAGGGHSCAVLTGGTVSCWGGGLSGQLGAGYQSTTTAVAVVGLAGPVSRVYAGGYPTVAGTTAHTCALLTGGAVQCWGYNANGQLGNGIQVNSATPVLAQGVNTATQVAVGGMHSCALLASGQMLCWGDNAWGQLGNAAAGTSSAVPVTVTGLSGTPLEIAAGERHTCARLASSVQCWGAGLAGQLGNGASKNSPNLPVTVSNLATAKVLAAGGDQTCAAGASGYVRCWGIGVSNVPIGVSNLPTCGDGVRNQSESGVDCGGPCTPCCTGAACCVNAVNGKACNDGNACTELDVCQSGVCLGTTVSCTTAGTCHVPAGCQAGTGLCLEAHASAGTDCSDGDACTQVDSCQSGVCTGGSPVVCAPLDDCHAAGSCDSSTGACSNPGLPDGTTCDDGSDCTQSDVCVASQCQGASPVICVPADSCHLAGSCDPSDGSCSSPNAADGAACDDGDPCTLVDTCLSGVCIGATPMVCAALDACHLAGVCDSATGLCSNPDAPAGTACSDGNLCTQTDTCQQGVCVGTNPVLCTPQGACGLVGVCNPVLGVCSNPKAADGTACSDGNACTQADTCQAGFCVGASAVVCAPSDQCHVAGSCNFSTGQCSNPNATNGTPCNDGNACTQVDTCQSGICLGTSPILCPASDQCHSVGTCDPASGACSNPPRADGTSCTDGSACTSLDTCQSGVCQSGTPKVCIPSDQCHLAGTCDATTGLCSNPNTPSGTACNDGNACTQLDTCQSGVCTGGSAVVCAPSDQCHAAGTCNTGTGACTNPLVPNGTACNDGNACSQVDTCQSGVCVGANPVVCMVSDQCHSVGTCDPTTGACSNPARADGTTCNDSNACTSGETCQSGVCQSGTVKVCVAAGPCTGVGTCDTASGQCSNPALANGTVCSDGNACTQLDTCQSGVCTGANPVVCTATDACHSAGVCNTSTGACTNPNAPNGTICNDGNACTSGDKCQTGACSGTAVACPLPAACHTTGVCDPASGVCSNPNAVDGAPCNDGNACTQTDTCQSGTCVGSNPVMCMASDQCHSVGVCNSATGVCSNPNATNGIVCNDGSLCTTNDRCQSGVCAGNAVTCSSPTSCQTAGSCDLATGVCAYPSVANGTSCNDGNACTQSDTCQSGVCTGSNPVVCTASGACRVPGVCNTQTGTCSMAAVPNGTVCNDGNACTQTDTCQSGACVGGNPKVCTPLSQCYQAGVCSPATGSCSTPYAPNGTGCDDGDACTQPDTCTNGQCKGSINCNDGNVCTSKDTCIGGVCVGQLPGPSTGLSCSDNNACTQNDVCQSGVCVGTSLSGVACNDGDACTSGETCQSGVCVPASTVVCTAQDACHTAGSCDPTTGSCSNPPVADGLGCNDGDACTLSDTCQSGTCLGASPVVCPAPDQCHLAGSCDSFTGVCSNPALADGTGCSDGSLCTPAETCQSGVCQGLSPGLGACYPEAQKLAVNPALPEGTYRQVVAEGDTVVVSAGGVAYVFDRINGTFTWTHTLAASTGAVLGRIALDGDTLVAGATAVARAFVFTRSGGVWANCGGVGIIPTCTETVTLAPNNGMLSDNFGAAVALSGDTVVVGSFLFDSGALADVGTAYVYDRTAGVFGSCSGAAPQVCLPQAQLLPSDSSAKKYMGRAVAIDGSTIVLGAPGDLLGPGKGAAYVFVRPASVWSQQARLVASAAASFGTSVAVSGETIAIGSPSDNRAPVNKAGAVYLFERLGTAWSGACSGATTIQCAHDGVVLVASDRQTSDTLGQSVELRGSTLVAGASAHDHGAIPTALNGGAAYVLRRVGGLWGAACTGGSPIVCSEDDELLPSEAATAFAFGTNKAGLFVDVSGSTVVVSSDSGPYVFDVPLSEGCGCLVDTDCVTGYCTDGVCCDSGCGASDPYDFQACSVFAGASQNGICQGILSNVCSAGAACFAPDACQ
jgi:hypothetical protein